MFVYTALLTTAYYNFTRRSVNLWKCGNFFFLTAWRNIFRYNASLRKCHVSSLRISYLKKDPTDPRFKVGHDTENILFNRKCYNYDSFFILSFLLQVVLIGSETRSKFQSSLL